MLVVPFGRRRLLGVVVGMAEESELPPERLAEPLRALEAQVPAALVRLGLWLAREYCSAPARGLALVLPPGTGTGSGRPLRPRSSLRAAPRTRDAPPAEEAGRLGARQQAALRALAAGPVGAAALGGAAGCDHGSLRGLERRGLVELARPLTRAAAADTPWAPLRAPPRSPRPTRARPWPRWPAAGGAEPGTPLLLHGVTGSGKTEVYLRAVAVALERGRSAIVLVPEIALTPQTAGRFVERFGDSVAVMHSQLAPRERYDEWWRMRAERHGSAWDRARRCSPRSPISA